MFCRYNPLTGDGAIGVEFAGTAVSSTSTFGAGIAPGPADEISQQYVAGNTDLQWSEGSYRGFFTLTIDPHQVIATYYAMRNVSEYHDWSPCISVKARYGLLMAFPGTPNLEAFASANFIVNAGANKLQRPVAGGSVLAGVLKTRRHPTE